MISPSAQIGSNVIIQPGVTIENGVVIGDNCYIDYHAIIKENTCIGAGSFVGAGCVLGEYTADFFQQFSTQLRHPLEIGKKAVIRSGAILYGDTTIGDDFNTGHHTTIRENVRIGHHVSIGTFSDIQNNCVLGNHVRVHSRVFMASATIQDYVWIFPGCVFTDDPTPPSNHLLGVTVESFAVVGAASVLLPGVTICQQSLVAAGAVVTKNVPEKMVVMGNPAKVKCSVLEILQKDGQNAYPWPYHFTRGMPWAQMGFEEWQRLTGAAAEMCLGQA